MNIVKTGPWDGGFVGWQRVTGCGLFPLVFFQSLPFLEYELHTQLLSKLKVRRFLLLLEFC